jgi:hypothetical protein
VVTERTLNRAISARSSLELPHQRRSFSVKQSFGCAEEKDIETSTVPWAQLPCTAAGSRLIQQSSPVSKDMKRGGGIPDVSQRLDILR